ncbi:hypothetical protein SERLA73DRAFT_187914 [Serpula lacrymans var. lacrymans S7.3]|uniref:VHS domain-containing protein n=1 Tax=Serpula lacrymans var. lacrymans (strain S7.3) TaxID=936435 RepID=F8Q9U0_SERL3|nr:hypothetical protein SERLA73DRAFT_187914 [Serpula lacrymans var. lacrymans S7.3]
MIGYLTATSSEDWSLVLEVCDRASANESNAREAVKALRREFKYAEPSAQLSAARLWAIMLRNASDMFLYQISSRKFVDTLEDVLSSSRTAPVVRERLMEVLAAAAFISSSRGKDRDKDGFRHLWRRLKPADKPDEGIPFDTEDAMFSPPIMRPSSQYSIEAPVYPQDVVVSPPILERSLTMPQRRRSPRLKHKIIPLEEDIRRLFQECKIGQGNANLLSEALAFARPEDLEKDLIREFYVKCRASQELIHAQVPWASAGAERSRAERSQLTHGRTRTPPALGALPSPNSDDSPVESTVEEDLLAALLAANESLLEALRVYDDLERIAFERVAEERSRREVRLDRRQQHQLLNGDYLIQQQSHSSYGGSSRTPSPSPPSPPASPERFDLPSIYPSQGHPLPRLPPNLSPKLSTVPSHGYANSPPIPQLGTPTQLLAPPPPAPHGPRSPAQASVQSRTPSPERVSSRPSRKNSSDSDKGDYVIGLERLQIHDEYYPLEEEEEDDVKTPIRPSAKALGKRKVIEQLEDTFDPSGFPYEPQQEPYRRDTVVDSDSEDGSAAPWNHHVHYVYDAAAERTAQRLKDGRVSVLVNGVH